jgi:hypothetical protein
LHYESWFLKCFVNIEMFNLVYESKIEYANIRWYVVLIYWSKNTLFDEIVYFFLSKCCKLRKNDVYDRIELKNDNESDYRSRSQDESESEIKIISRIEHETQICSRCETFSKTIAITFKWIREDFRFWILIDQNCELIIELRHNEWFRNKCCERWINNDRRWILEIMIIVIIRFNHCRSKFCRVVQKFNND